MIVLGVIVLLIGVFFAKGEPIVWQVGLALIVIGVVLALLGHRVY